MILLNFSHPLTSDQLAAIEELMRRRHTDAAATDAGDAAATDGEGPPVGRASPCPSPIRVIDAPAQFDHARPFAEQVTALVDGLGLSPVEWQTAQILVNPPALNVIAVTLLAELHGRMGYFPPVVRLRPVAGALPPRFEAAEIINLQAVREAARNRR